MSSSRKSQTENGKSSSSNKVSKSEPKTEGKSVLFESYNQHVLVLIQSLVDNIRKDHPKVTVQYCMEALNLPFEEAKTSAPRPSIPKGALTRDSKLGAKKTVSKPKAAANWSEERLDGACYATGAKEPNIGFFCTKKRVEGKPFCSQHWKAFDDKQSPHLCKVMAELQDDDNVEWSDEDVEALVAEYEVPATKSKKGSPKKTTAKTPSKPTAKPTARTTVKSSKKDDKETKKDDKKSKESKKKSKKSEDEDEEESGNDEDENSSGEEDTKTARQPIARGRAKTLATSNRTARSTTKATPEVASTTERKVSNKIVRRGSVAKSTKDSEPETKKVYKTEKRKDGTKLDLDSGKKFVLRMDGDKRVAIGKLVKDKVVTDFDEHDYAAAKEFDIVMPEVIKTVAKPVPKADTKPTVGPLKEVSDTEEDGEEETKEETKADVKEKKGEEKEKESSSDEGEEEDVRSDMEEEEEDEE
jgi:hypothetical protein